MILEGNQRGGARQMAAHLMNTRDNEHVEVHEVSGFLSDTVHGALNEIHAASKGTRCKQYLFSVSLNPPAYEVAPIGYFEAVLEHIEKAIGLEGQPRVVVFHEKEGRRHAHCIWSRIDGRRMKAINLPHYKRKLNDLSRRLYLQYGWKLPQGFIDKSLRDPNNFAHEEWQQSKRTEIHPAMIKTFLIEAWRQADNRAAFENALKEKGFHLAQGDKRGFVVMNYDGEVYSLSRMLKVKTKELVQRLGDAEHLPSTADLRIGINDRFTEMLKQDILHVKAKAKEKHQAYLAEIAAMKRRHAEQRRGLDARQQERRLLEERERSARMRKGLKGIWFRVTGQYEHMRKRNELETEACWMRDREERQQMIENQLRTRLQLQETIKRYRQEYQETLLDFRKEIGRYEEHSEQIRQESTQPQMISKHKPKRKLSGPSFEPRM